jgi:hypothetical protein
MMAAVAGLLLLAAAPGDAEPSQATLTVPLPEALRLLAPTPGLEAPPAPVSAGVVGQRLQGRLGADGLEVAASFTVTVLDGARWSRLALLRLAPGVTLLDAGRVEGGMVSVRGQEVVLVTRTAGTFPVELKLGVRGVGAGVKTARLCRGADALEGVLKVEAEGELEVLDGGALVASAGGCWTVSWRSQARARVTATAARPPLEPQVSAASARLVSTMEGRARLTVRYALELDREQPLAVTLPEGWTLTRLTLDEVPQKVPSQRVLALTVGPARPGDRHGSVGLTLERDFGIFHLSGRLALELPAVSWPTKVVELSAHLPTVFEYHRAGGSLEPSEARSEAQPDEGAGEEEAPGRRLGFRQYLVAAVGPTVELQYSVDLNGRYFSLKGGAR